MSKQRTQDEDLLFSQSELAELDAELAPQAEEPAASLPAAISSEPQSFDDLVDTAFNDEETAEKQPALMDDPELGAAFDGFVEAEPANTDEIMAVMAEQAPISSVAAPQLSGRPSRINASKAAAGEIASVNSSGGQVVASDLPSVIFDDSPFSGDQVSNQQDEADLQPQMAALAAAFDAQTQRGAAIAESVISSSPPPSANGPQVEVGTEGGGHLPSSQASAIAALAHTLTDEQASEVAAAAAAAAEAGTVAPESTAPATASSSTPVMALDDEEFHFIEDSDDHGAAVAADESAPASDEQAEAGGETAAEEPAQEWSAEPAAETAPEAATEDPLGIDSSWAEAAEGAATAEAAAESAGAEDEAAASEVAAQAEPGEVESAGESVDDNPDFAADEAGEMAEVHEPDADGEISGSALSPVSSDEVAAIDSASQNTPARRPAAGPVSLPPLPPPLPPRMAPPPPPSMATKPAVPPPRPVQPPATKQPAASAKSPPPPAPNFGEEPKLRKKRRNKQWFEEIFDEDYLHTLPFMTPQQTEREVAFLLDALALPQASRVLDIGCGYGRHAMEIGARGYRTVGLDLSLPLLIRATDAARRVGVNNNVDFVHGDMRDMTFDAEFDGAYCFFSTFGYFDDDTNRRVATGICRALKPGGRLVLDMFNRDYLIGDLPTRVWWQGDGCVVLEEVDFNYFTSRLQVQRQIILEDGRQLEQEISIRAYSLHEIGKVLHHAGFKVLEVSGGLDLRGRFYGNESRQLVIVAERRADAGI